jgi:hypothetical protein
VQRLFKLEWWRCLDSYRIDVRTPAKREPAESSASFGSILESIVDGLDADDERGRAFIVPKSDNWGESYRPLDVPAAYRAFAAWDDTDDGLLKLTKAYGFMVSAKAKEADIVDVRRDVAQIRALVEMIDSGEWLAVASDTTLGIGRLRIIFEVVDGKPVFGLQPASLFHALRAQALYDAVYGPEHRKCRNTECDRWFPITGPEALRADAEYHDEACRRRHAYQMKKESQS